MFVACAEPLLSVFVELGEFGSNKKYLGSVSGVVGAGIYCKAGLGDCLEGLAIGSWLSGPFD